MAAQPHVAALASRDSICLGIAAAVLSRPQPDLAVRLLALIEHSRDTGRFLGASRDLAIQAQLRSRLEQRLDTEHFTALWSEGLTMTLDDAAAETLAQLARLTEPQ
jgi:hypothetical protein